MVGRRSLSPVRPSFTATSRSEPQLLSLSADGGWPINGEVARNRSRNRPSFNRYCSTSVVAWRLKSALIVSPARCGSSFRPNSRVMVITPSNSGMPTKVNSKKPMARAPASKAASLTSTFTGDPVRASFEPACAAKTIGMSNCDGGRRSRSAKTTTTGKSAAIAPLRLIRAVNIAASKEISTSNRVRLSSPAPRISICPAQAVTPVRSSAALTTKRVAMNITAGSPKPESAWFSVTRPVA